ncbi:MAG: tetratricopeptide repeat protein [Candidatus Lokiarchaeota archaeon]|nr:tetratricopeptide repeat protein [Candidatus Lokiarchaeota archaeon]
MEVKKISKKRSLRQRLFIIMISCILIPFILLTIFLVFQLLTNIDYFIGLGYSSLETLKIPVIITIIIVAIIISFIILFAINGISRRITSPIIELTNSIERISEGDLTQEIPLSGRMRRNEFGVLAQSFQGLLVTMRLGNKSYYQGNLMLAFKNYNAALELFQTTKNLHGEGMCLNNLGNIYRNWGDYDKARESYNKAIKIGEEQEDIAALSSRYNNRALLFLSEERWQEAMDDFNKAIKIDDELGDDLGIASRKRNIGVLHMLKNELDLAQEHLDEAFRLDSKWENNAGLAEDEFQLGRLSLLKSNPEIAENHLKSALNLAKNLGNYPLMKNVLEAMVQLYESQDNTTLHHKAEIELSKVDAVLIRKKDVVFVIDQSGSMSTWDKMTAARTGALGVFNETINVGDRVAILAFHSLINNLLNLTEKKGNVSQITNIFKSLESVPYETCLYDAIAKAIDILLGAPPLLEQESQERQKWIITLTDGEDNRSKKYNSRKVASYIRKVEPPLNFILIGVGPELKRVHRKMTEIVDATPNGRYITIFSAKNVSKRIADAFTKVKEIMVSSEIEGFIPEEGL